MGSGREIRQLVGYLDEGEGVEAIVGGSYDKGTGLLGHSDGRLLFIVSQLG